MIFRDARPFAAEPGARAVTLPWPMPGTVAGAVRSYLGNSSTYNYQWNETDQNAALTMAFQGAFLVARKRGEQRWTLMVPAPSDAVPYIKPDDPIDTKMMMMLRPMAVPEGSGVNWPTGSPDVLPMRIDQDVKPDRGLDFWSFDDLIRWLSSAELPDWGATCRPGWSLGRLDQESRVHVAINPTTRTASDGALFTTTGLLFRDIAGPSTSEAETAIYCRISSPAGAAAWQPENGFLSLGGERRMASVTSPIDSTELPVSAMPVELKEKLTKTNRVRLQLLTPAIFSGGWVPDWLTSGGTPPVENAPALKLIGASTGRRIPVSGWDMKTHAEKATRYLVPAGSVYFLQTVDGLNLTKEQIDGLWFAAISDDPQDRRDGYGTVVPGVW